MILVGDWQRIPMHQIMTYLNYMCKSYKSSKFYWYIPCIQQWGYKVLLYFKGIKWFSLVIDIRFQHIKVRRIWTPCVKVLRVQSFIDKSHVLSNEHRKYNYIWKVLNDSHWWWTKDSNASKYDFWTPCVKVLRVQSFIDISHVLSSEDIKYYYISKVLNGSHWWLT